MNQQSPPLHEGVSCLGVTTNVKDTFSHNKVLKCQNIISDSTLLVTFTIVAFVLGSIHSSLKRLLNTPLLSNYLQGTVAFII